MKNYIPLFLLIIITLIIGFCTYKIYKQQNIKITNISEISENFDFSLKNLSQNNENFSYKDLQKFLKENEFVMINFFASWCENCIKEHDILKKTKELKNIKLIGVSFKDFDESSLDFVKKYGNPYEIILSDSKNQLGKIMGVVAVPESFLIDKNGKIILYQKGELVKSDYYKIKYLTKLNI